jgi:hypothetical protein
LEARARYSSVASGERALPIRPLLQFGRSNPLHLVISAEDKVDRLEACTASLPPVAAEPDAQQAAAVAAEPDAQQAAAVAAEPDVQQAAAVAAAEPDVQQAAAAVVVAEPHVQQAAAAAAVEPVAQQQAAAVDQQVVAAAMQWGVRPLMVSSVEFAAPAVGQQRAASCSPMATTARQILAAAVRFWFRATSSLARAPR